MLTLRLPEFVEKRLDYLAATTGRTKSFYAREAILRHLEEMEDVYLAERTLERVRSGKEKVYSSDELEKLLVVEQSTPKQPEPGSERRGGASAAPSPFLIGLIRE